MESLVRTLRVIWRAELLIIEAKMQVAVRRIGAIAFAGLIVMFGLGMLNLAGFFALERIWGPVNAALGIAAADFLVALLLVLWASRLSGGRELALAQEVRDAGLEELEAKAERVQDEFETLREELSALRKGLTSVAKSPLDGAVASLLVPLLTALVKSMSGRKKPSE